MPRIEVVDARPPNFEDIVAVFPQASDPGVIFAYDGRIYAPGAKRVSPEIQEHESVHIARQAGAAKTWWDRYLADATFRLEEELEAHRVEYCGYCRRHSNRVKQGTALLHIATKLSSPLYGSLVSVAEAKTAILR